MTIARQLGLPEKVITDAEVNSMKADDSTGELINQLQAAKAIAEENKQITEQTRAEAQRLEQEHRAKLDELVRRETSMSEKLRKEVFTELRSIKGEIERLEQAQPSQRILLDSLHRISQYITDRLREAPEEQQRLGFIQQLKMGDKVHVRSLNRTGTLNEIDPKTQKAVVQLGPMQMTISLDDIEDVS